MTILSSDKNILKRFERIIIQVMSNKNERFYLDTLKHVLENGTRRDDRTGTGTISVFGTQMRFDISTHIPILTTKFVPWKSCIKELLWFLNGHTDANILKEQNVKIWDGNSSRQFLNNRGLAHLPEGDIGAGYGFQWRHFGASYLSCKDDYSGQGFDQIRYVQELLKTDPFSRRIFMSAWNPGDLERMALPPCHVSAQFYVDEDPVGIRQLSCHMYQRSVDMFLGEPWNILSYSILTCLLAKLNNFKPKEVIISTGDTHIYSDHIEQVKEQLSRSPLSPATLVINDDVINKSINEITFEDFNIINYEYHPAIKAVMAV